VNRWKKGVCPLFWVLAAVPASADPFYRGGAISTSHPIASAAGLAMLDQKGNAVDAAVAAAFTLAVVTPYHSGLGGGGFAVTWDAAKQRASALDFREVAPKGASRDMYMKDGVLAPRMPIDGPYAVGVPGAVLGYLELLEKKGKLPRAKVLAPAIKAAREGFPVTPKYDALCKNREEMLVLDKDAARVFLRDAHCPPIGTIITQPELARTLERIAREGAKAFYAGPVAKAIAAKAPLVTEADLAAFKTREREPLEGSYRRHRIVTMPLPSAGGIAVLETLGVLERATKDGIATHSVQAVHVYLETLRHAFQDRGETFGDPAFVMVDVAKLLSQEHLDTLAKQSFLPPPAGADAGAPPPPKHTSHLSVVDRDGNAVALTTTVNYYFGSCVWVAGFLLNDQMDDFSAQPGASNVFGLTMSEANAISPGKIPVSSMSPVIVFQEGRASDVELVVGGAGGSFIPTSVVQVISNVIDGNLAVSRAMARPRIHHQWQPDVVMIEPGALDPPTQYGLEQMGYHFTTIEKIADTEAVLVDPVTGLRSGGSDPRNEGAPAGQP
jgi:gamma-glutamyltranspeptidase / glutathione hydrolase